MQLNRIDDRLAVSPQIAPADVAGIAAAGFRAILCNRPDAEGADQPTSEEVAAPARHDGCGFRPLTLERGRIVLAGFGCGGALRPSFPAWRIDGTRPSRRAWRLRERLLPAVCWKAMLRGREWMAKLEPATAGGA